MKPRSRLILEIFACLLLAAGAYLGLSGWFDSLFAYRSPLKDQPPAPGPALDADGPFTRQAVFVLVDGLRLDVSLDPQAMPFLNELRRQGASAAMHSRPPSYSQPGYSVLFTGTWPELSDGPAMNLDEDKIYTWTQDNLFSSAHRAGLQAAVSASPVFAKLIPAEALAAGFFKHGEGAEADRLALAAAQPWLEQAAYQLVLIHLDLVDYAGHYLGGPFSPEGLAAARQADAWIREIAGALDLSQDTLLVASDHGHIDRGGHGGQDRAALQEPFVLAGAGVTPGAYGDIQMVDLAPTLAVLLGTNLPASGQGRPLLEMLALPPERRAAVEAALAAQQARLLAAYQAAIGAAGGPPASPPAGLPAVASYQAALEDARLERLRSERLPRLAVVALFLMAASAGLVAVFRKTGAAQRPGVSPARVFLGAGLYLLLFNLGYAFVARRAYSLSSISSQASLLISISALAAGALVLARLLAFRRGQSGGQRASPALAAEDELRLVLAVDFLLSLPVLLAFVLYGPTVRWTLPDFGLAFLAFLSLLQILFAAPAGLALAGLAGLSARTHPSTHKETNLP